MRGNSRGRPSSTKPQRRTSQDRFLSSWKAQVAGEAGKGGRARTLRSPRVNGALWSLLWSSARLTKLSTLRPALVLAMAGLSSC